MKLLREKYPLRPISGPLFILIEIRAEVIIVAAFTVNQESNLKRIFKGLQIDMIWVMAPYLMDLSM